MHPFSKKKKQQRIHQKQASPEEKKLKVGFLIVIAARSQAVSLKSDDIRKELDIAFTKLGMFESL